MSIRSIASDVLQAAGIPREEARELLGARRLHVRIQRHVTLDEDVLEITVYDYDSHQEVASFWVGTPDQYMTPEGGEQWDEVELPPKTSSLD